MKPSELNKEPESLTMTIRAIKANFVLTLICTGGTGKTIGRSMNYVLFSFSISRIVIFLLFQSLELQIYFKKTYL